MLYYMLSATAVYGNEVQWYVLYSRIGPVILGPAESAMSWVYCKFTNDVELIIIIIKL